MTRGGEAIVLGAGVIGVATAYALARRGLAVTIVDRAAGPGQGTSYANGAQLSYAYTDALASPGLLKKLPMLALGRDPVFRVKATLDPDFLRWGLQFLRNCTDARFTANTVSALTLSLESRLAMHALIERHPFAFGHRMPGKMHLFYDRDSFAAARRMMALKHAQGVEQQALGPDQATAIEPALASATGLVGVVHSPEDEIGDAFLFANRLLEILQRDYGVQVRFGFEAREFEATRDGVRIAGVAGEILTARHCIMCLGTGATAFLRKAGVSVPVWPMKGYSFTAPMSTEAPRVSITDALRKIVFCRLSGRMRVAGLAELGNWDPAVDPERRRLLVALAREALPHAAAYDRIESDWAGLRPMSPSSVPIITRARDGLLLNIGHGMLGWTLAMGSAERVAALTLA